MRVAAIRAAPNGLGSVERYVGVSRELVRPHPIRRRQGYADTDADADGTPVDFINVADSGNEPPGEFASLGHVLDPGLDDRELVAAQARHRVAVADRVPKPV